VAVAVVTAVVDPAHPDVAERETVEIWIAHRPSAFPQPSHPAMMMAYDGCFDTADVEY